MMIHEVTEQVGRYKRAKRIGRGIGSGKGKTGGRGTKGFGARSGNSKPHEGGGTPLYKRFPKRGFTNAKFKVTYQPVNLNTLESAFDSGDAVTPEALKKLGLISNLRDPVKVLGYGELKKKLTVTVAAYSANAKEKIEQAGGSANVA
jgi:large subunit ribosomal protein L15